MAKEKKEEVIEEYEKKKEMTFRGKTLEELKDLDIREFVKHIKSKPRRAALRQFQKIDNFINRCEKKIKKNKPIKTHLRGIVIVPRMLGMKIQVYNGKVFVPVEVVGEMLGHRLGEFAPARGRIHHGTAGVGTTRGSKSKSVNKLMQPSLSINF